MQIFNNKKIYIFFGIVLTLIIASALYYFVYVSEKKAQMQADNFAEEAKKMQLLVAQKIYEKQKATTAIALALSQDPRLLNALKTKKIDDAYYKNFIQRLHDNTEYKNIWINIIDRNCNDIYRSWTDIKGDNLADVRKELVVVMQTKKTTYTVSSGKFALTIKGIIPIIENGEAIGIFEIISHFNSIAIALQKFKIESVVLLDKKHSQKIQYPFTENFLDGHYVANLNAPKSKLKYLQKHGLVKYLHNGYRHENGYLIVSYPLKNYNNEVLGYYIMFKAGKDILNPDDQLVMFKWMAFGFVMILIAAWIVNLVHYFIITKQKNYLKKIIDSSTNIVIIKNDTEILDTNATFFKYFTNEKNVDEFKKKHPCICDLFVKEKGYLQAEMDGGMTWAEYVLEHPQETHVAKIRYNNKVYYFRVSVSLISEEKGHYGVIMSDVTAEEEYKLELEKLSITDPLTGIYNRRYFDTKLKEKITLAQRYGLKFSLIMFDIDHFKKINDEYGHDVGDMVLIEYSKLISEAIREGDIFCRVGGEEFMIIVPYTDGEKAKKIAEKLRSKVENYKKIVPVTMSFGVNEYIEGETSDHIYKNVDDALYKAKENGRNQVVLK